jgi:serine/threonine protein kinase
MEYFAGGDLFSKISKGKFHSNLEIACFFKQLLSGINYIHSAGIAHRLILQFND